MRNKSSTSKIGENQPGNKNSASEIIPFKFLMMAFSFSWVFWIIPVALGHGWISWSWAMSARVPLIILGSLGPLAPAFALHFASGGKRAMLQFGTRALRFRIPIGILILALLLFPAMAALAIYLLELNGGAPLARHRPD